MNLVNKGTHWVIAWVDNRSNKLERFPSVDSACDYLVDVLGVNDQEVDTAVIHLHTHNHKIAAFNEGKFAHTLPE